MAAMPPLPPGVDVAKPTSRCHIWGLCFVKNTFITCHMSLHAATMAPRRDAGGYPVESETPVPRRPPEWVAGASRSGARPRRPGYPTGRGPLKPRDEAGNPAELDFFVHGNILPVRTLPCVRFGRSFQIRVSPPRGRPGRYPLGRDAGGGVRHPVALRPGAPAWIARWPNVAAEARCQTSPAAVLPGESFLPMIIRYAGSSSRLASIQNSSSIFSPCSSTLTMQQPASTTA